MGKKELMLFSLGIILITLIVGVNAFEVRNVNTGEVKEIGYSEDEKIMTKGLMSYYTNEGYHQYLEYPIRIIDSGTPYNEYDILTDNFQINYVDLGSIWSVVNKVDKKYYPEEDKPFFFKSEGNMMEFDGNSYSGFSHGYGVYEGDGWTSSCTENITFLEIWTLYVNYEFVSLENEKVSISARYWLYYDSKSLEIVQECSGAFYAIIVSEDSSKIQELNEAQEFQNQRISTLESWKDSISNVISNIQTAITGLIAKNNEQDEILDEQSQILNDYNERIEILEESEGPDNEDLPDYLKYLSYTDRKTIVCGYAKENHLNSIIKFNVNCTLTYRQYSTGERSTCLCREIR